MLLHPKTDCLHLFLSFVPTAPVAARDAIAGALADVRSDLSLRSSELLIILDILRRAARRFEKRFRNFGRDAYYGSTLPAAIRTYAEDPPFLSQALRNILENGEDVPITNVETFFDHVIPEAIRTHTFDVAELRDEELQYLSKENAPSSITTRANETALGFGIALGSKELRAKASEVVANAIKHLDMERREQIADALAMKGTKHLTPFERYTIDSTIDEQQETLLLPVSFRAKLEIEAEPEEAEALLTLLAQATRTVARFGARARELRSDDGILQADYALIDAERIIRHYVTTPSKAYSMLARERITHALLQTIKRIETDERLMDELDNQKVLSRDIPGVVTQARVTITRDTQYAFPTMPMKDHFLTKKSSLIVTVNGPILRLMDHRGRLLARRKGILKNSTRVSPIVLLARGESFGVIRVTTDVEGNAILHKDASNHTRMSLRLPPGTLPRNSTLTFDLEGSEAVLPIQGERIRFPLPSLGGTVERPEADTKIQRGDVVVFDKPGCNISFHAPWHTIRETSTDRLAKRFAEVVDLLERTYPGRRLETILTETLEIHAASALRMENAIAGTNKRGDIWINLFAEAPVVLASGLIHEDAHMLCEKIIGTVTRYIAEPFRTNRPFFGTKTVIETIEEGVHEIFARLVQARFLIDALRSGTGAADVMASHLESLFRFIRLDIGQFQRHGFLTLSGEKLVQDFLDETTELECAWECRSKTPQAVEVPDVPPFAYAVVKRGSPLANLFEMDAYAEGICTTVLERYGLLPSARTAMLKGHAPPALPSPASAGLLARPSIERRLAPRAPKEPRFIPPPPTTSQLFNDWLTHHPDQRSKVKSYREEWKEKLRDAKRRTR